MALRRTRTERTCGALALRQRAAESLRWPRATRQVGAGSARPSGRLGDLSPRLVPAGHPPQAGCAAVAAAAAATTAAAATAAAAAAAAATAAAAAAAAAAVAAVGTVAVIAAAA